MVADLTVAASSLLRLVNPGPDWETLAVVNSDIDPAFALAAQVRHLTLICNEKNAHARAGEEKDRRPDLANLVIESFDADPLLYAENHFDLVLCHHCDSRQLRLDSWLQGVSRILKPEGLLALTTYLIPGTRLHGKKARRLREAGQYIDVWHRLRDQRHRQFLSQNKWEDLLLENGFKIENQETADQFFDFDLWVNTAEPNDFDRTRLKAMLIQAPEKASEFLTPQISRDRIRFRLPEFTILARSQAKSG